MQCWQIFLWSSAGVDWQCWSCPPTGLEGPQCSVTGLGSSRCRCCLIPAGSLVIMLVGGGEWSLPEPLFLFRKVLLQVLHEISN